MGTAFLRQLQQEFKGYNGQKLAKDLMAGLTVAAVALPLALAFGVSAGATAACGLVTAIVAGLIISALTGGYCRFPVDRCDGNHSRLADRDLRHAGHFVATLAGALLILGGAALGN
ncbi:MAG: SulP family inorganic anion transporter [Butyricicoccus sp.]